jgi:translation initiation factor IF-2
VARTSNEQNTAAEPVAEKPAKTAKAKAAPRVPSVEIPRTIAVRQLAELIKVDTILVIKQLMRNGIMANINQVIDYDMAASVAKTFGYQSKLQPLKDQQFATAAEESKKAKRRYGKEDANLEPRPPIVTVMGHVDHGKTKLLDAIRETNVVDQEAGGITQHIGAYQAVINGQKITFLDTPGHEAFTAMRAHGANVTDVTILVVAADDGVMPQTLEAINHAKAAEVPIVVAINKIDKDNANPDRVKQQLAEAGLVIEDWGGDTVAVEISAKQRMGIETLLESVLLVSEMEDLKANPHQPAAGVVIEAELDKSRGPLATVLIQTGTLKEGDTIVVGMTWGRVRAMFNDLGKRIKKAEPSTPVAILGLVDVPGVGDTLKAVADEKHAQALLATRREEAEAAAAASKAVSLHNLFDQISSGKVKELDVVLKTDVQGSIEPIRASLEDLGSDEVKVRIIHSGTGNITESDVMLASASTGLVIGFNVETTEGARKLAAQGGVDIRNYSIIYNLVDDVSKALSGLLEPTFEEVVQGHAEVRAIFTSGKNKAAGCYVTDGKVVRNDRVRVVRGKEVLADSVVSSLKRFKDDVREVAAGYECGIGIKDFNEFQEGDVLEFYKMEQSA